MFFEHAALFALLFAAGAGVFSLARWGGTRVGFSVATAVTSFVLILFINWPLFYFALPPTRWSSMWWVWFLDAIIVLVVSLVMDGISFMDDDDYGVSAATGVSLVFTIVLVIIGAIGINGDVTNNTNAHRAANFLHVVEEDPSQIPDTDTNNMLIVPADVASGKVSAAMSNGQSGQLQLGTYTDLGAATPQWIDGHLEYAFQPQFDGSGNKHRLHNTIPGYFLYDASNPDASPVERFGPQYQMHYSINGGQQQDVVRYVYTHGYSKYFLDDPTLEIRDDGKPFITITLLAPSTSWTRPIPVGLVLVDPDSGQITRYALNDVPSWIDRVYGSDVAENMVNTWAYYNQSGYNGVGSSNAGRYKVSGSPVLVYTTGGHAAWLMLLTSMNSDSSVWRYVLFDTQKNEADLYTPTAGKSMGIEDSVLGAFNGTSQGGVKSSGYSAENLALHKIYGRETWVVTYVSNHSGKRTFAGIGMLDAYDTSAADVAFGTSLEEALSNYQTALANPTTNSSPQSDAQDVNITGTIASKFSDVESGTTYFYFTLTGDTKDVYRSPAKPGNPELLFSVVGDPVAITYINLGVATSTRNIKSFDDTKLQMTLTS